MLNEVAEKFKISCAAVSKHMKIPSGYGLDEIRQQDAERYCEAKLKKFDEVTNWIEKYKQVWKKKLDELENYLNELKA